MCQVELSSLFLVKSPLCRVKKAAAVNVLCACVFFFSLKKHSGCKKEAGFQILYKEPIQLRYSWLLGSLSSLSSLLFLFVYFSISIIFFKFIIFLKKLKFCCKARRKTKYLQDDSYFVLFYYQFRIYFTVAINSF